jgi:hypothetical protein
MTPIGLLRAGRTAVRIGEPTVAIALGLMCAVALCVTGGPATSFVSRQL